MLGLSLCMSKNESTPPHPPPPPGSCRPCIFVSWHNGAECLPMCVCARLFTVCLVDTWSLITWLMAPLIYCHMLSTEMKEELKNFTLSYSHILFLLDVVIFWMSHYCNCFVAHGLAMCDRGIS